MILQGDCRDRMAELEPNSVDAIVTDPPYELGFMGKKWDGSGIAYDLEVWNYALRVLKPGGYLLAFGGTRTYHRLACAIEDTGFVLHPMIGWCYGSGFPKATNLSKQIDKNNGKPIPDDGFRAYLRDAMRRSGVSVTALDKYIGTNGMVGHYIGKSQPEYPTSEKWSLIKDYLHLDSAYDYLIEWAEAEREVIGKGLSGKTAIWNERGEMGDYDITAPATDAARKWDGWSYGRQSLKPSLEPICMAQKPPEGRMVDNVARWGVGAVNIDGCRIGTDDNRDRIGCGAKGNGGCYGASDTYDSISHPAGRWPANLILDPVSAEMIGEQSGHLKSKGTAARFFMQIDPDPLFYCAKAAKKERGSNNNHPTVKPIKLMRYLVRLVTPPRGIVLDPFAGSGTTLLAAKEEGFEYIGIELEPDYIEIAKARLESVEAPVVTLEAFAEVATDGS